MMRTASKLFFSQDIMQGNSGWPRALLYFTMIAVIQRVSSASVEIEKKIKSSIGTGLLVLVGVEDADGPEDIDWLAGKIVNLRIFNDAEGVMNVSVKEAGGEIIVVSQFTLHASTKKGNRPSYIKASKPDIAIPLYEKFVKTVETVLEKSVQTGEFGADMKVSLLNDGPVTIVIDTKDKK
jgi:D-aminoacyl-tRNA deacylase